MEGENWRGKGIPLGRLNLIYFSYGNVERVKKIKYYAFIHFEERDEALSGERKLLNLFQKLNNHY